MNKKLFLIACAVLCCLHSVYADGEKGMGGAFVTDESATVQPGAYATFSTVYNGKRYYLGVDTTAAKSGDYRLAHYNAPCFAAMWQVGALYSYDGNVRDDKNYQRTVKSVYLKDRNTQDAWLALGTNKGAYSELTLATDTANATLWYTEKDNTATNRYIQGYLYYFSNASGKEIYRYLTYDALYGFRRAYAVRPSVSQRISIWHRTTGDNMSCRFFPETYEYEYNPDTARVSKAFAFTMVLETGVDRFRSQYDGAEFDAVAPTVTDNQVKLRDEKGVNFFVGWSSTHGTDKHHYSVAHLPGPEDSTIDSVMMLVRDEESDRTLNETDNRWSDVMFSIGASPKNLTGVTRDHTDYLHIHMTYNGREYTDSTRVVRRFYTDAPIKTLDATTTPPDYQFPYFTAAGDGDTKDFTVSAQYMSGDRVLAMDRSVVASSVGETHPVDIAGSSYSPDTTWIIHEETGDTTDFHPHQYDTLLVSAFLPDGTPAVSGAEGATSAAWLQSVALVPGQRDRIRVIALPYTAGSTELRVAQIKYIYTYRHSHQSGDTVRMEKHFWVTQLPETPPANGLYSFSHQTGKSKDPLVNGRQQAPQLVYTTYAIPGAALPLPIHRDHWGYYRWYVYQNDPGDNKYDKDIMQKWNFAAHREPVNHQLKENEFQPINTYSDTYSRGRFDMRSHFIHGLATDIPAITYKEGDNVLTKTDTLACDVSAYTDTLSTGNLDKQNLSALTEPTLSYRQLFAVRPAQEMADSMERCRKQADPEEDKYLQEELVIAPRTRTFHLQPYSPFETGQGVDEGHLQYVYYYNPNEENNEDPNMGSSAGLDKTKGESYHRIGLPARKTGYGTINAKLVDLTELKNGESKQVIMVNPRTKTGYALSKSGTGFASSEIPSTVTDTAKLRKWVESTFLEVPEGTMDAYRFTITRGDGNTISIKQGNENIYYHGYPVKPLVFIEWYGSYELVWSASTPANGKSTTTMTWSTPETASSYITNARTASYRLQMGVNSVGAILYDSNTGYLSAYNKYTTHLFREADYEGNIDISDNNADIGDGANQAWLFYEIVENSHYVEHAEHPIWSRRRSSTGEILEYGDPKWTSARLMPDGSLEASFSYENDTADYWLKSEHFNLAHIKLITREALQEGPSLKAIITEDSIDNHYEVLATLGLENTNRLPRPGTTEVKTPYYHLQWDHTQFSYHYPVGTDVNQIDATQRVTGLDPMPAKGEYITTNKFEKPGHATMQACAGAEYGYMFCYNRASKPLVFLDFEMERPGCPDQELTLVANFGSPTPGKEPHVTARMYGKAKAEDEWKLIYTFLTGKLPQSEYWYQVALPLDKALIEGYNYFRCVGTVTGTDDNEDAFFLFDRMRLLAKNRPITAHQKRTTCARNDSIYIISRIDYRSSEMKPGNIICYQYQKKQGGVYVPMETSIDNGGGTYTRMDAVTTEVYPGYYKVGMTAEESVTSPQFKSLVLGKDYGAIVVPEHDYDPSASGETAGQSAVRKAVIDAVQEALSGDRSAYYDETGRVRSYSVVTTADEFEFGDYDAPQTKFYANEGTADNPYWVMYIVNRFDIGDSEDATFRIAMQTLDDITTKPNFFDSDCSNERIVQGKSPTIVSVDGNILGYTWHNYTRAELEDKVHPERAEELLKANTSHILDLHFSEMKDAKYKSTDEDVDNFNRHSEAHFDLLRAFEFMRGYADMTPDGQAAADAEWEAIYKCTPGEFQDAMSLFRAEDEENPNRRVYSWNNVTRESFHWGSTAPEKCDAAYNLLNRLVVDDRLLEIGMSSREVYVGNNQDLYYYLRPIPASGSYIVSSKVDGTDSTAYTTICNNPIWVELHSAESKDSLRFGYDKHIGGTYMVPVVRASAQVANTELPVRIAAITHTYDPEGTPVNDGIILGWDSTQVIDSNDPEWLKGGISFRYAHDRILQSAPYSDYYHEGDTVFFRPVDAAHIAKLTAHNCTCYNYNPQGTTMENIYIAPKEEPLVDCNEWHVQDNADYHPGYQHPNTEGFRLKGGYWYKFRLAFHHLPGTTTYNEKPVTGAEGEAFFILAVVPDTVQWTPSHADEANYWNDDDNWTAIINGEPFHGALARVPMEGTRVIVTPPAQENMFPIVNYELPGDIERGDVDFGFKTATCDDILFKAHSLIAGQEKLDYHRALVDLYLPEGQWRTFSPALDYIYSGDIYMPYDTTQEELFTPLVFESEPVNASHNRVWPYLFFQSFYNSTVDDVFRNSDYDGDPLATQSTRGNATWQTTNVLNRPLPAGKVNAIQAWGPEEEITPGEHELIVRLPKQETSYSYYDAEGNPAPTDPALMDLAGKPAFGDLTKNLAFDKTKIGNKDGIDYTLTNEVPAQLFFFGNPTMGLIDMFKFCRDNADMLDGDGSHFIIYELGEDGTSYITHDISKVSEFFLRPMHAVGLMASSARTELTLTLKPSSVAGSTEDLQTGTRSGARRRAYGETQDPAVLYISAANTTPDGSTFKAYITLVESTDASDGYVSGEDALSLVSDTYNETNLHTPLALYSVCDNRPLMYDRRETLENVPLAFALMEPYAFSARTILSFATEGQFAQPLYLHDVLRGDSIMIINGLTISVETPLKDQIRYYINAGTRIAQEDASSVPTGLEQVDGDTDRPSGSNDPFVTRIYDMLGRLVATLGADDLLSDTCLPAGVYTVQRGAKAERMVIR